MFGVPRDRRWRVVPFLLGTFALVAGLFAGLLSIADLPGVRSVAFLAFYLLMTAVSVALLPQYLFDRARYMVTDRHVIYRRGSVRTAMDCRAITYARVHWHRSAPGVGHLEVVRAVPFGPLSRKQRLFLHNVVAPDRLYACIRQAVAGEHAGFGDVGLTDRLDEGEHVLWGAGPAGMRMGVIEGMTGLWGAILLVVGGVYLWRTLGILMGLEEIGLPVRSMTWLLLFFAIVISSFTILGIGGFLLWKGTLGARAEGSSTEYLLTEKRLLIRRGLTELSVDRARIVDVAALPRASGLADLVLILDGPSGRALDDNGALSFFSAPSRALVPPVLYEVQDGSMVRDLLLA